MPAVSLTTADLAPFAEIPPAKAQAMIADAVAMAAVIAPCILEEDFASADAAKAVIRGAVLRWHEAGQGAVSQLTALQFSQTFDTRQPRRNLFWPSEITMLEKLCQDASSGGVWAYDTVTSGEYHADWCAFVFGANYCDCGAILAGVPLWEQPG